MKQLFMILLTASVAISSAGAGTQPRAAKNPAATTSAAPQAKVTVKIGNFQFTPKDVTISPGTTVEWLNEAGRHLVKADDGAFKSEVLKAGDKYEHKFDKAGTFAYHCEFHGDKGGKDMAGKIVVRGRAAK